MELTPAEIVRRAYEGWNAQDLEGLLAVYRSDAVYDLSERLFNPGVYRGRDELVRLEDEIRQAWKSCRDAFSEAGVPYPGEPRAQAPAASPEDE